MSDPDELSDRIHDLLREHVIDCLYRLERLEQTYLAREPRSRLPQLTSPEDVQEAMEKLKQRLDFVEKIAEQSE